MKMPVLTPDLARSKRLSIVLILSLFVGLSLWITWPISRSYRTAIPTGDSPIATVPMLNAWSMWWNADRLTKGFVHYWNAPIFAPQTGVFALSEPQPATLIVAPLLWLFSLPTAYNTYLCLAIALNGLLSYAILRQCAVDRFGATCGGVAMSLHPLGLDNLEAIQLLPLWGILGVVWMILRLSMRPHWSSAFGTSVAFLAAAATCLHHTLFFVLLLPVCLASVLPLTPAALRSWLRSKEATSTSQSQETNGSTARPVISGLAMMQILCGLILGVCLSLPLILPMQEIHARYDLQRDPQTVRLLSANLDQWLTAPGFLSTHAATESSSTPLLPGLLRSGLALLSLLFFNSRNQFAIRLLFTMAVTSLLFSFGLNLNIFGWHAWETLCEWFPPFARVRSPYRFAYFTQLAILLLASLSASEIRTRFLGLLDDRQSKPEISPPARPTTRNAWRLFTLVASYGLMVSLAIEVLPARSYSVRPPGIQRGSDWTEFIRQHASEDDILLCLPVSATMAEADLETDARWMMFAAAHHRPIMNGYSGYFPKAWLALWDQLRQQPLGLSQLAQLRALGTRWIVVENAKYADDLSKLGSGLRSVYDDSYFQIYELQPLSP